MRAVQTNYRGVARQRRIRRMILLGVLTCATLSAALALGNMLHDRLQQAEPLMALTDSFQMQAISEETTTAGTRQPFVPREEQAGIYGTIDAAVLAGGREEQLRTACEVAAELYDGVSVMVAGEDGLRFRLTAEENADSDLPDASVLRKLASAAAEYQLTLCAVWYLPDEVPSADSVTAAAARELASLGFDEILFTGLTAAVLEERDVAEIMELTDAIRTDVSDLRVGFAFCRDVFADVDSAPHMETLAMYLDVTAVDFGAPENEAEAADYALACAATLYGSIPYYPLRILLRGGDAACSAQCAALREVGYTSIQHIS